MVEERFIYLESNEKHEKCKRHHQCVVKVARNAKGLKRCAVSGLSTADQRLELRILIVAVAVNAVPFFLPHLCWI